MAIALRAFWPRETESYIASWCARENSRWSAREALILRRAAGASRRAADVLPGAGCVAAPALADEAARLLPDRAVASGGLEGELLVAFHALAALVRRDTGAAALAVHPHLVGRGGSREADQEHETQSAAQRPL